MKRHWSSEQGRRERDQFLAVYPDLDFSENGDGSAKFTGIVSVPGIAFTLNMRTPASYPRAYPSVFCCWEEIEWIAKRHVFSDGEACLCTRLEMRKHWPEGSTISDFFRKLVYPFLVAQSYYQAHGHWPPGRDRSHGAPGILESVLDVAAPLGVATFEDALATLRLLARKNTVGGHEPCPCGGDLILRKCHAAEFRELRAMVDHADAAHDLQTVLLDLKKPDSELRKRMHRWGQLA